MSAWFFVEALTVAAAFGLTLAVFCWQATRIAADYVRWRLHAAP